MPDTETYADSTLSRPIADGTEGLEGPLGCDKAVSSLQMVTVIST